MAESVDAKVSKTFIRKGVPVRVRPRAPNILSDLNVTQAFWDRETEEPTHTSWLSHPAFSLYALRRIDPLDPEWPVDWFTLWLRGRRFRRGLSVGCGAGAFERDIARHGLCDRIDAFDASITSIRRARAEAAAAGYQDRIRYFVADFNRCSLPRQTYDIVFFHQSMHHVANLEELVDGVRDSLTVNGLVYLDEYIGPSRVEWSDERIAPQRAVFDRLPDEVKRIPSLPLPIQADDPSEALRSSEIVSALEGAFEMRAFHGYGGNLLSVIYPHLVPAALTDDVVAMLVNEDRAMVDGDGRSYYAVIVAAAPALQGAHPYKT